MLCASSFVYSHAVPAYAGEDGQQIFFTIQTLSCLVGTLGQVSVRGENQQSQTVTWTGKSSDGSDITTVNWWWIGRVTVDFSISGTSHVATATVPLAGDSNNSDDSDLFTATCGTNPSPHPESTDLQFGGFRYRLTAATSLTPSPLYGAISAPPGSSELVGRVSLQNLQKDRPAPLPEANLGNSQYFVLFLPGMYPSPNSGSGEITSGCAAVGSTATLELPAFPSSGCVVFAVANAGTANGSTYLGSEMSPGEEITFVFSFGTYTDPSVLSGAELFFWASGAPLKRIPLPTDNSASSVDQSQPERPIIFVPGITGSFLNINQGNGKGKEVWPDAPGLLACLAQIGPDAETRCDEGILAPVAFTSSGVPADPAVDVANGGGGKEPYAGNPLEGPLGGAIDATATSHVYDILQANVEASGYEVIQPNDTHAMSTICRTRRCFIPFGVDWRRSSSANGKRLLTFIASVLRYTDAGKVNLLAHSQGGLIVEAMLDDPKSVGLVDRVATLGTPYLGAPKLLTAMLFQEPCMAQIVSVVCALSEAATQKLLINMPGTLELLPSNAYFHSAAYAPLINGVSNGTPKSASYKQMLTQVAKTIDNLGGNRKLAEAAESWHAKHDSWHPADPTVQLIRAIGYDANGNDASCSPTDLPCDTVQKQGEDANGTITAVDTQGHLFYGTGDGTVPLASAAVYNPKLGFDDRGGQYNLYFCAVSHAGLAQDTAVWQAVEHFLEGTTTYAQDEIRGSCPNGTNGSLSGQI